MFYRENHSDCTRSTSLAPYLFTNIRRHMSNLISAIIESTEGRQKKMLASLAQKITQPTSRREDDARREYILCVLLIFLSALSILFTVSVASLATIPGTSPRGIPIWISVIISGLFLGLLYLARKGWWKFSSYAFLGLLIIPTLYSLTRWGTLLPIPLLTLSLIIVLIGILKYAISD